MLSVTPADHGVICKAEAWYVYESSDMARGVLVRSATLAVIMFYRSPFGIFCASGGFIKLNAKYVRYNTKTLPVLMSLSPGIQNRVK